MAHTVVTANNLSPLVLILTWLLCIYQILTTLTRGASKLIFRRSRTSDDWTSIVASAFGIVLAGVESNRISHGLGKRMPMLAPSEIVAYQKATYATELLYFPTLFLSELSLIFLMKHITPIREHRIVLKLVELSVVFWTIVGIFVTAFQCGSSRPWVTNGGNCIDLVAWRSIEEAFNLAINLALIAIPISGIYSTIQLSSSAKLSISLMFALRLSVCVAIICKIVYINKTNLSGDFTFDDAPTAICSQFIISFSIMTYCFLGLKPFFGTLEAGFIRTDNLRRRGQLSNNATRTRSVHCTSAGKKSNKIANNNLSSKLRSIKENAIKESLDHGSVDSDSRIVRRDSVEVTTAQGILDDRAFMTPEEFQYPPPAWANDAT